jgi:Ca2+-binding EF-hand superfamily protein
MDIIELKGIFEYELKRKLAQRSLSPIEELRKLIGALKFYDYSNSMVLNKDQWIRGVLRTGLCGFNISDLANVFDLYDPNKTGNINYLNFARYLYGKEQFKPIVSQSQENNNIDNNNNIQKNIDIDKSKFVPPGLYERNVEENDLENIVNRPELKINNPNINENKNINIDDSTIGKRRNYHMTKSQSQMLPPKTNNNINQIEEQNENKIVQNLEQDNNNIKQGKENKNFFKSLVDFLRPKINTNNGVTYYSLAHHLKSNEDAATKTTSLESLLSTIKLLQLDINPDDIINLYACLDYTQTGKVSTDEILRIISGDIDEKRKISIISKFAEMDKNKTGYLPISLIKKVFNAKFHPDCFLGKKPENEVQDEFMFTFEVFCFLKGLGNDQEISFRDFVEYYTPISASIENDNYFDDILLGSWNIEDENILPKKENEININGGAQINQNIPNEIIENNNLKIDQRNRFQIAQTPNINDISSNSQNIMPNRNLPEEKKYGKIKYNPITNEFRTLENYSNTRNNNNNI